MVSDSRFVQGLSIHVMPVTKVFPFPSRAMAAGSSSACAASKRAIHLVYTSDCARELETKTNESRNEQTKILMVFFRDLANELSTCMGLLLLLGSDFLVRFRRRDWPCWILENMPHTQPEKEWRKSREKLAGSPRETYHA